ncbi:hypothetical protein C0992_002026 [Termitomyces sp. T32_za158]|nr:hypothetical protein C0992_002026 [Termitomyces sp. T32_za158]
MSQPKFKIAVCGGGVGGLTFAVAMSRYPDVEVEIFEAASEFSPIGAGIGIWPRAWRALVAIGLEDLAQFASRPPGDDAGTTYLSPLFELSAPIRLESGEVELLFDDNSLSRCDLLVGADGIKSAVRQTFLQEQAQEALTEGRTADADSLLAAVHPVWSGALAYRALVPVDELDNYAIRDYGTEYLGKDWAIIAYPIAKSTLINIVAYHISDSLAGTTFDGPWIEDVKKDVVLGATSHWEPEFIELAKGISAMSRWAIHTVRPLHSFASDKIALLGDAAHAMAPHQGSGAGQAIEDGCLLAELLGHRLAKRETLPIVLRIYDFFRRPFALDIAQKSFQNGSYLSLTHEDFILDGCDASKQVECLHQMGEVIVDNWRWAWETSLVDMVRQAITTLEEALRVGLPDSVALTSLRHYHE